MEPHRKPHSAAGRFVRCAGAGRVVLRHAAHQLARTPRSTPFDRGRLHHDAFADQSQPVRRTTRQRRDRRPDSRCDRCAPRRGHQNTRRADQCSPRTRPRLRVDRFIRRKPAPPRLPQDTRPGSVEGESRRSPAAARRLAQDCGRWRRVARPDVRVRYVCDRRLADRSRHRTELDPLRFWFRTLEGASGRTVATADRRSARPSSRRTRTRADRPHKRSRPTRDRRGAWEYRSGGFVRLHRYRTVANLQTSHRPPRTAW